MAESQEADAEIFLFTAQWRGIIPLDGFKMSKRSKRYFKKYGYEVSINQHFQDVIEGCAQRKETWINPVIKDTFIYLHNMGHAHSVEVLKDEKLVGGLYGLAIGGAFFAESVFQIAPEAHKAALFFCHRHLIDQGFQLWDVQYHTEHLAQFGCIQIPAKLYKQKLNKAIQVQATFD